MTTSSVADDLTVTVRSHRGADASAARLIVDSINKTLSSSFTSLLLIEVPQAFCTAVCTFGLFKKGKRKSLQKLNPIVVSQHRVLRPL